MAATRSKLPLIVFFASLALGLSAGSWLLFRQKEPVAAPVPQPVEPAQAPPAAGNDDERPQEPAVPPPAAKSFTPTTPAGWLARIGEALETGDFEAIAKLTGDAAMAEQLNAFAGGKPLKLRKPAVREVGELELNALSRWAIELEGDEPGHERIFLDLRRKDGRWSIERLVLPKAGEAASEDSLLVADAFLRAVLRQDFELAKSRADAATVSDATLAGLCILFEEGGYQLRPYKPLRVMLQRPDATGYLVNVETSDNAQAAQFSLLLKPGQGGASWHVTEVNLDQLLREIDGVEQVVNHLVPCRTPPKG